MYAKATKAEVWAERLKRAKWVTLGAALIILTQCRQGAVVASAMLAGVMLASAIQPGAIQLGSV